MGLFDKLNDVAKTAAASAKNAASTTKEQASALGANEALDKLKGAAGDATQKAKGIPRPTCGFRPPTTQAPNRA